VRALCAIRLAAPFTASDPTVPTRCPYTLLVIAIEACPRSLDTTAMSAWEAIISDAAQCRRPWKVSGVVPQRPLAELLESRLT
jgi:hypothetical protein